MNKAIKCHDVVASAVAAVARRVHTRDMICDWFHLCIFFIARRHFTRPKFV